MSDRYAVVGNPIAHSKSPQIHAAFARQTGEDLVYQRLCAPLDGFAATVAAFASEGGRGLNVTMPFKREAFALAARVSARAHIAGAVNTLRRDADGWYGDNSDGPGLTRDLDRNLGAGFAGCDVLILGAGGASRGIVVPLLERAPRSLTIANRTVDKAVTMASDFAVHGAVRAASWAALEGCRYDLVIHATGAGLGDGPLPAWPDGLFAPGGFAYDLAYADRPTPFLRWASTHGAAGMADGLGMLVEQAAESFLVWRGVRPDTAPVLAMLRGA